MLNRRHYDGLNACLDDLGGRLDRLRVVELTSAKRSFVAGAGSGSFVQTLLDAGPDPRAMAAAGRRALDAGLVDDPAGADVAAGFPPWTGGILYHLTVAADRGTGPA